jgi:tetratricopeptide (TPR) repeat protein
VRLAQDTRNEADILNAYGAIEERMGNFEKAKQLLGEASAIAGRIGYKSSQANVEGNLGHLMYMQKMYPEAEQHFTSAQKLFRDLGNVFGEAQTFNHLAVIKLAHNNNAEALPLLQTAIQMSNKINAVAVILNALVGMSRVWNGSGRRVEAAELLAFVLNHPAQKSDDEIEKEGRPVYETLEKELPAEAFKAAVEKGQKRELSEVVTEALAFKL